MSIIPAVYLLLTVHYVYSVVYHPWAVHFYSFFEEKVLQLQISKKFNANYESAVTGIASFLDEQWAFFHEPWTLTVQSVIGVC